MCAYIIRRLLLAIPTVFIVSIIVFFTIRLIPGDAIDAIVARMGAFGAGTFTRNTPSVKPAISFRLALG